MDREQFENNYSTLLNGAIDNDDTTLTVDAVPVTMTHTFRIRIDDELILVGSVSGSTFINCTRGIEGTTAVSHLDNAPVTHVLTATALTVDMDPIAYYFGTPTTAYEFETTSLTGLTTMGSPDLMNAHTSFPGHLIISDNDGTQTGLYAAVTAPFTAISKMTAGDAAVGFQYIGMFTGITTPGKFVYMGIVNGGTPVIAMRTMTGPTDGSPGAPSMYRPPTLSQGIMPSYWAISCVSDTDISYYYSPNGVIWWPMLLNHNNTMTVGSIGFAVSQYAGSGVAAQAIWDYLRIWNTALTIPALI